MRFWSIVVLASGLGIATVGCKKDKNPDDNPKPNNPAPIPKNAVTQGGFQMSDLFHMSINNDGRYICITTKAKLLPSDQDDFFDVYRYDRVSGNLELISSNLVSNAFTASISADGSKIIYTASQSPQLPTSPTAIYLWDSGTIVPLQEGQQDPNSPLPMIVPLVNFLNIISPDARFMAGNINLNHFIYEFSNQQVTVIGNGAPTSFSSDGSVHTWLDVDIMTPNKQPIVYVLDRNNGTNLPITKSDKHSDNPKVSGNGRWVVFASEDGSFLGAEDNNGLQDVFLFDRQMPKYTRLTSKDANGPSNFPDISNDGEVIVFASTANNLGPVDNNLVWDIYIRQNGQLRVLTEGSDGNSPYCVLSGDGKWCAFVSEATVFGGTGQGANIYIAGPLR